MILNQLWELREYRNVLSDFLNGCDEDLLIEVLTSLRMLQEDGNQCASTVSENLGYEKLLSLKARFQKLRIRMIYYFTENRQVVFVDVIVKKQRALAPQDLKTATRRKKAIEREQEKSNIVALPAS